MLVHYKPGATKITPGGGANKGKPMTYVNLVTGFQPLGEWTGGTQKFAVKCATGCVALVQKGGAEGQSSARRRRSSRGFPPTFILTARLLQVLMLRESLSRPTPRSAASGVVNVFQSSSDRPNAQPAARSLMRLARTAASGVARSETAALMVTQRVSPVFQACTTIETPERVRTMYWPAGAPTATFVAGATSIGKTRGRLRRHRRAEGGDEPPARMGLGEAEFLAVVRGHERVPWAPGRAHGHFEDVGGRDFHHVEIEPAGPRAGAEVFRRRRPPRPAGRGARGCGGAVAIADDEFCEAVARTIARLR